MSEVDIDGWYRRYGEAVYARCRRIVREEALAMDLMQETFLRAHKYRASYRGESGPLPWLFTIADRRCATLLKKQRARAAVSLDDVAELQASPAAAPDRRVEREQTVHRCLALVDEETARILTHRLLDGLDMQDVVRLTGIPERTVRRRFDSFVAKARALAGAPA